MQVLVCGAEMQPVLTDPQMPYKGGITVAMKTATICEAFGGMCEGHRFPASFWIVDLCILAESLAPRPA